MPALISYLATEKLEFNFNSEVAKVLRYTIIQLYLIGILIF